MKSHIQITSAIIGTICILIGCVGIHEAVIQEGDIYISQLLIGVGYLVILKVRETNV